MRALLVLGCAAFSLVGGAACFVPDHAALGDKLVDECRVIPGVIPSCACTGEAYADPVCAAAADFTFDEAVSDEVEQQCVLDYTCEETGNAADTAALRECLTQNGDFGPPATAPPACLSECVATMESCANTRCDVENVLFCMRDERACEERCGRS